MFERCSVILDLVVGGNQPGSLTFGQMLVRSFIVYFFGIILVQLHSRFFGLKTGHDRILRITVGSIFANIIIGRAPFLFSIGATLFLVGLNWILTLLSVHSQKLERFFKGTHQELIRNGKIIWKNMRANYITKDELMESIRLKGGASHVEDVEKAVLENDGEISVIAVKNK